MKFYAVKSGRKVGVYTTWDICKEQVHGYPGSEYKSFNTMKEALDYIGDPSVNQSPIIPTVNRSPDIHIFIPTPNRSPNIPIVTRSSNIPTVDRQPFTIPTFTSAIIFVPTDNQSINNVLYVDGGQNRQTGNDAWGCVTNKFGTDVLIAYFYLLSDMKLIDVVLPVGPRRVIVANFTGIAQQNNGAELLSLIAGLRIALTTSDVKTIYSDSDLCVRYWSKSLGTTQRQTFDPRKISYIDELIHLRKEFEKIGGSIVKIRGDDNLADLGYH